MPRQVLIQLRTGTRVNRSNLAAAEPAFLYDSFTMAIGNGAVVHEVATTGTNVEMDFRSIPKIRYKVVDLALGSPSTPSLVFDGDLDTGLYRPNTNELGITAGGNSRVIVKTTGMHTTGTLEHTGDSNIEGKLTVTGDVEVTGNLIQTNINALSVEDNTITLNSGETGSGVTAGTSGILVDRGIAGNNASLMFHETDDSWRIGLASGMHVKVISSETSPLSIFNGSDWLNVPKASFGNTAHDNPAEGDIFYNNVANRHQIYGSGGWRYVGKIHSEGAAPHGSPQNGDTWWDDVNDELSIRVGGQWLALVKGQWRPV